MIMDLPVSLNLAPEQKIIRDKIYAGESITDEEGIYLFEKASLPFLGSLQILSGKNCMVIPLISTETFILSLPMYVSSVVIFAAIANCMPTAKPAGNLQQIKCWIL